LSFFNLTLRSSRTSQALSEYQQWSISHKRLGICLYPSTHYLNILISYYVNSLSLTDFYFSSNNKPNLISPELPIKGIVLSIEVSMKIDFSNAVSVGQNVNEVLSLLSSNELSLYKEHSKLLATILLACYCHQDDLKALKFKQGLARILSQQGRDFIISNQIVLTEVIETLNKPELLYAPDYLLREEITLFYRSQRFLFKRYTKEFLIDTAKELQDFLLNHFFNIEMADFLSSAKEPYKLSYLKQDLKNLLFAYLRDEDSAFLNLEHFAKEKPLAAIFLTIGSCLFLTKLRKEKKLQTVSNLYRVHFESCHQEAFLGQFRQHAKSLSINFYHHNSPIFMSNLKTLLTESEKDISHKQIAIHFSQSIFSRWLDLSRELDRRQYYDFERLYQAVVDFFSLPIMQAIGLSLIQSKRFASDTGYSIDHLQSKIMNLDNPEHLLALGRCILKGKYPNLTVQHFGAPECYVEPLLRSRAFAMQAPHAYAAFLLRPLTSWLWLKRYFSNYANEYRELNACYQNDLVSSSDPSSDRNQQWQLSILQTDPNSDRMRNFEQKNFSSEAPARKRSNSIEVSARSVEHDEQLNKQAIHFNNWLVRRSHHPDDKESQQHLAEFKRILQGKLTSLFTGFTAINSGKVSIKPGLVAFIAEVAIGKTLSFVPYAGLGLEALYGALSPISLLKNRSFKNKVKRFEQFLASFREMDRISDRFVSLLISYHYSNILQANPNVSHFKGWYKRVMSGKYYKLFKEIVSKKTENYITGVDDKKKPTNREYKSHWDQLINEILVDILASVLEIEDLPTSQFVDYLSGKLTYMSDEPLRLDIYEVPPLIHNIYHLSRLTMLAYESEPKFKVLANHWGYESNQESLTNYVFIFKKDIQVIALTDKEKICLSFRGTATSLNVFTDLNFKQTNIAKVSQENIEVHNGFYNGLMSVWDEVSAYLKQQVKQLKANHCRPKLYLTGHSLGGAMAAIAAFFVKFDTELSSLETTLCTFGQPRCGNQAFADYLERNLTHYYRVVNYLDIIPKVPLEKVQGYMHAGQFLWLNHEGLVFGHNAYEQALKEKDIYNWNKVRTNLVQYLSHLGDHSMIDYQLKLARFIHQDPTLNNRYADYLKEEFERRLAFNSQQEREGDIYEEFEGREKEKEKGKEKVKDDEGLTEKQRIEKLEDTMEALDKENIRLNAELSDYKDKVDILTKNYNSRIEILEAKILQLTGSNQESATQEDSESDLASQMAQFGFLSRSNQARNSEEDNNQEDINQTLNNG
jgi:hypothetical protein